MADFAAMVAVQRKYFDSQATKPYEFRREQLKKLPCMTIWARATMRAT